MSPHIQTKFHLRLSLRYERWRQNVFIRGKTLPKMYSIIRYFFIVSGVIAPLLLWKIFYVSQAGAKIPFSTLARRLWASHRRWIVYLNREQKLTESRHQSTLTHRVGHISTHEIFIRDFDRGQRPWHKLCEAPSSSPFELIFKPLIFYPIIFPTRVRLESFKIYLCTCIHTYILFI